jgi:pheromone alpha factor receptor
VANFPAAGSLAVTMVVLLLPLSSLWAGMAIDEEVATLNFSHLAGTASTGPIRKGSDQNKICGSGSQFSDSTFQSGRNDYTFERKGSHQPPISPSTIDSRIEGGKTTDSTDIDLEGRGVRVDKSFNLQSRQGSLD